MINQMMQYAFGNVSCAFVADESAKVESALREGYVVLTRCNDYFAVELVASLLHLDTAKALLASYGKGHMLINPDGVITYAVNDTDTVMQCFED